MFKFLKVVVFVLIGVTSIAGAAKAQEPNIAVVLSNKLKIYELALNGVESVSQAKITVFNLDGQAEVERLEETAAKIKKLDVKVVLAIGPLATHIRKYLDTIPLVYCMVDNPKKLELRAKPDIAGVALDLPPEEYVKVAQEIIPDLRFLGFIYNPDFDTGKIEELRFLEDRLGFYTVGAEVKTVQDIQEALKNINGKVDVLWLPNDPLIINEQNFTAIIDFVSKNKIPTFVSFRPLLALGAVFSVSSNITEVGIQAGKMANEIISGRKKASDFFIQFPTQKSMYINFQAAGKIGVKIPLRLVEWEKITSLYESGIEFFNEGNLQPASNSFKKILELDPEHSGAKFHLQKIADRNRLKDIQHAITQSNRYLTEAKSKFDKEQYFSAIDLAQKSLEWDQNNQEAKRLMSRARLKLAPEIDGYIKDAISLYSKRQYVQAISILDKILIIAPEHNEAQEYKRLARQKHEALRKLEGKWE